jgi:hypothetical protein
MMDQAPVDPAAAVGKWMHVNKAESRCCGVQHWVNHVAPHPLARFQQSVDQIRQVRRAHADEFGERFSAMVASTQKHSFAT